VTAQAALVVIGQKSMIERAALARTSDQHSILTLFEGPEKLIGVGSLRQELNTCGTVF
jgi:hypothetical protein